MGVTLSYSLLSLGLFLGMVLLQELGWRLGRRRLAADPAGAKAGTGAVEGAVFALLGLLVAFTFSGAASRFDARRDLIVQETNAIGTAYLRLDVLAPQAQADLKAALRDYLDARLAVYRALPDRAAAFEHLARANALQATIWTQAVAAVQAPEAVSGAPMLLLPALNDVFDIGTTRTSATMMHPPAIIFQMLFALGLASALLAGYAMAGGTKRSLLHAIGFAAVLSVAVYVILDLEYPRLGLIRVGNMDQTLVELRASMD